MKKPAKKSKDKSKSDSQESDQVAKGLGLFDHIKHIQKIQDPDYFNTLTELDKKTFNHFMILRALSMNPTLLDIVAMMYQFIDTIPSPQFYQTLISIVPIDRNYYPWIKAKKKHKISKELIRLVMEGYEVSPDHAVDYIQIFTATDGGIKELHDYCKGFGLSDKEVEKLFADNDDDE